tara:strand:- start:1130 stop:2335 length:1206 start_codon:yes stop_codon:yes gene_type:complete
MALHVRHPVWVFSAQPGAWTFTLLFFVESVSRATLATVMPLVAYGIFGDKQSVSLAYTAVSLVALALSFTIPSLIRHLSRRWTYSLGALLLAACALLLNLGMGWSMVLSMLLRTFGAALLNITLNLYIMDNIRKQQLVRSEPQRYAIATIAWTAAPFIGAWSYGSYGVLAPTLFSAGAAVALFAVFWMVRLNEKLPIRAAKAGAARVINPLSAVPRFVAQPRLRLAWAIAFSRSSFWVTFFIYTPILMLEGGYSATTAGAIVAFGNLMLFTNIFVERIARRYSVRRILAGAQICAALALVPTALFAANNALAAGILLVVASFFVSVMDGLGPVPFLRAVRAHERPQMTTVYRTYLDVSELIPPLVYAALFGLAGFTGVFLALAALMGAMGLTALRYLPRSL